MRPLNPGVMGYSASSMDVDASFSNCAGCTWTQQWRLAHGAQCDPHRPHPLHCMLPAGDVCVRHPVHFQYRGGHVPLHGALLLQVGGVCEILPVTARCAAAS